MKSGPNVSPKIILRGNLPVLSEIMVKSCVNVDKALSESTAREPHFLQCMSIPKRVCLPMLDLFFSL